MELKDISPTDFPLFIKCDYLTTHCRDFIFKSWMFFSQSMASHSNRKSCSHLLLL